MKSEMKFFVIVFIIELILGSSFLYYNYKNPIIEYKDYMEPNNNETYDYMVLNCSNKTVLETSYCVNKFVRNNFNYTDDNCKNANDFNKLLNEGGNCCSWSNFYVHTLKELGLRTQRIRLYDDDSIGHQFVIAYNDSSDYCILDQQRIMCV